MAKSSSKNVKL